jgi:hypothetical protein
MRTATWECDDYVQRSGAGSESMDAELLCAYTYRRTAEGTEVVLKSCEVLVCGRGHDLYPNMTIAEIRRVEKQIAEELNFKS